MSSTAIVYCDNQFGKMDGKITNGLVRHSEKYEIVGIIDSSKAGMDAGEFLDGIKNGIPIFHDLNEAVEKAISIIKTSSKPLLYGFSTVNCEAQLKGLDLAQTTNGFIDSNSTICHGKVLNNLKETGVTLTTITEITLGRIITELELVCRIDISLLSNNLANLLAYSSTASLFSSSMIIGSLPEENILICFILLLHFLSLISLIYSYVLLHYLLSPTLRSKPLYFQAQ